jgi:threonine/homoserine/homoserine lactone efflux protein
MVAFVIGSIIGFVSAIPVAGPISAVILSYGLKGLYTEGRRIALGASLVESAYAFFAFWGFGTFLADSKLIFTLSKSFTAILLAILGVYFFVSKKIREPNPVLSTAESAHPRGAFFIGAAMTLINPTLIATWTVVATALYSATLFPFTLENFALFSIGLSIGIFVWFTLMLKLIKKNRTNLSPRLLDRTLKAFGTLLFAISAAMIYKLA